MFNRFRLGRRETDTNQSHALSPFHSSLVDVGGMDIQGNKYVILKQTGTGHYYARALHANVPTLLRAFPLQ